MNRKSLKGIMTILLIMTLLLQTPAATAAGKIPFNQTAGDENPPIGDGAPPRTIYLPSISSAGTVPQEAFGSETESAASLDLGVNEDGNVTEKPQSAENGPVDAQAAPAPGMELFLPEDLSTKIDAAEEALAPAAVDSWTTIMTQGFEGAFPTTGWRLLDANGATNGEYYWKDTSFKAQSGSWSAWAARGGANGLNPANYDYPNNMRSWMIYGPFSLSDATDAQLSFGYWNQSELNYDYFGWYASLDGTNFSGYRISGDSNGWRDQTFDLKSVPYLGNLMGKPSVWIAFYFISDGSIRKKGPFVDNVVLQKYVNAITCPNQYKAEYFNNRTLSGSPTVTRCENWPINYNWETRSPVSGVGSDNFSVRWTGTANFTAGTYNFKASADDGVKVWLDNSLLINGWRDQPTTDYIATRYVSAGSHAVKIEYYEAGGGAVAGFAWTAGISGIDYYTANTRLKGVDNYHVFKIDMQSSNLSFEMVMAQDSTNVNQGKSTLTNPRERVGDMATRYRTRNPVLVVNADYSSPDNYRDHGPEGLTVKNGQRFDGILADPDDEDDNEWKKSSLSITSSKGLRIGRQTACSGSTSCRSWTPDRSAFYNTVGGGPLFVENGTRIGGTGSTAPCTARDDIPNISDEEPFDGHLGYCTDRRQWTAVGMSSDGRYLIIIVTGVDGVYNMDDAARVLLAEGAARAMKLDGGGSSQAWYKPYGSVVYSNRPIANAIMVLSN